MTTTMMYMVIKKRFESRILESTGTVYGDIGTSVLYTVMEITREAIHLKYHVPRTDLDSYIADQGGVGLLTTNEIVRKFEFDFWALIVLTIKYDLVMRADDRGEGGDFALWSLLRGHTAKVFGFTFLSYLVVTAASLRGGRDHYSSDQYVGSI